jgi:hypothetical protein
MENNKGKEKGRSKRKKKEREDENQIKRHRKPRAGALASCVFLSYVSGI